MGDKVSEDLFKRILDEVAQPEMSEAEFNELMQAFKIQMKARWEKYHGQH
jgi:hypothetical protein